MTVLPMDPSKLPAAGRALFAEMSAKRQARGEHFGGPYIALLNHPELARHIEELGFFLKFDGVGLSIHRALGRACDRRRL
jgi:4-carboxymuconolactone decarboxylase